MACCAIAAWRGRLAGRYPVGFHSRRGVLSLAGRSGFYEGEWREGISLIKWSLELRHSKPVSEPAKKEIARLKLRCGFRHPVAGRESGAGFAFALLGLRSHSRHSHPLWMTLKDQPHRLTFPSSELAHEEPVAELPPSPCFRAADTSFSRLGNYVGKVHESAAWLFVRCRSMRPKKSRTAVKNSAALEFPLVSEHRLDQRTASNLPRLAGSTQEKSLHLSSAGTLNISPRLATKRLNTAQVASFGEIAPALDLL
jgi:hypothetical protein